MYVTDQIALDLPGVAAPPPRGVVGVSEQDQAVVLGVLTRLIVKTIAPGLITGEEADGE
jgi:hypothetical protein